MKLKNAGLSDNTVKTVSHKLNQIARHANMLNPEEVKTYIANATCGNQSKQKLANCYQYFAKNHMIAWENPHYRYERKIPLIPTTENIHKIIAACSRKYATIFTILEETGLETRELETVHRADIDAERGIINAIGCKGHNSRSFKLSTKTADMLRAYLNDHPSQTPFPTSKNMGDAWRETRNALAKKLNEPQLRAIPLRNLRHHFATKKYDQTKDILLVKQLLGHKKLETTMFYTQLITFAEDDEYICKTATNAKEAADLIEHGFTYVLTTPDELMLFRKRK